MATGCLLIRAGGPPKPNRPPEVIAVSPSEVVVLDTETLAVLVQARDADEEALVFTWIVDNGAAAAADVLTFSQASPGGTVWNSRLTVHRDRMTPDSTILCLITDGESGSRLDWTVEIP
jgi:hypothetical protein